EDPIYAVKTLRDQMEVLVAFSGTSTSRWRPMGSRVALGFVGGLNLLNDYATSTDTLTLLGLGGTEPQPFTVQYHNGPGRRTFQAGAMFEMRLSERFSIEGDALHESLSSHSRSMFVGPPPPNTLFLTQNYALFQPEWKFPVLAKYRLPRLKW